MVYEIITNAMVLANIIIMTAIAYNSFKTFSVIKNWLDLFIGILGVVWVLFYIYVLFAEPTNASMVGQVFVRPLNVLTFTALLVLVKIRRAGRTYGITL